MAQRYGSRCALALAFAPVGENARQCQWEKSDQHLVSAVPWRGLTSTGGDFSESGRNYLLDAACYGFVPQFTAASSIPGASVVRFAFA